MTCVAPGDTIAALPASGTVRTSSAVVHRGEELCSTQAGALITREAGGADGPGASSYEVRSRHKRYTVVANDDVIGMVTGSNAEEYKVDIRGSCLAILPVLAFESATKRNRPKLVAGDLVFARVVAASADMEPELSCTNAQGKAAGYGPLQDGFVFDTDNAHARKLRARPSPPEVEKLSTALKWEFAVGANGRVWVRSPSAKVTAAVVNVLQLCARIDDAEDVQSVLDRYQQTLGLSSK